jgi:hypothetical protein
MPEHGGVGDRMGGRDQRHERLNLVAQYASVKHIRRVNGVRERQQRQDQHFSLARVAALCDFGTFPQILQPFLKVVASASTSVHCDPHSFASFRDSIGPELIGPNLIGPDLSHCKFA